MVSEDNIREAVKSDDLKEILFFRIGDNLLACLSSQAARVVPLPAIVPLLEKHPVVSGVFGYRGRVIAAADISGMLSEKRENPENYRWIVVIKGKNFLCGILADEIKGIEHCPSDAIVLDKSETGFFKTRLESEMGSAIFFDTEALLAEEELLVKQ